MGFRSCSQSRADGLTKEFLMPKRSLTFSYGVIGAAAVLALVACGSSTSKTSTSRGAVTTTTPSGSPAATAEQGQMVKTKSDPKLGTILADASDKTLYNLTNNGQAVACTGPCIAAWPPLTVPAGVTMPTGTPGVTGLGVAAGPDGTQLVTVNSLPLYRFAKDGDAGDAYGEGIQSFGGTWHVVKTTGSSAPSSPSGAPAPTSARSGGGY